MANIRAISVACWKAFHTRYSGIYCIWLISGVKWMRLQTNQIYRSIQTGTHICEFVYLLNGWHQNEIHEKVSCCPRSPKTSKRKPEYLNKGLEVSSYPFTKELCGMSQTYIDYTHDSFLHHQEDIYFVLTHNFPIFSFSNLFNVCVFVYMRAYMRSK